MLTTSSRIRIQEILARLSEGNKVTLEERIYISKYATNNQNVANWLRKASLIQRKQPITNSIDELLDKLDLISGEPHSEYDSDQDDLDKAEEVILGPGDNFHVYTGLRHQMIALEDTELYEFSTQHFDEDSYRIIKGD